MKCRVCPIEIVWYTTEARNKSMPLNAVPDPAGNVIIDERGHACVLGPLELAMLDVSVPRFMPHHATCTGWKR